MEHKLKEPYRWHQPARVFVNSMSDLFHPDVPNEYLDRVFAVMEDAVNAHLTFQVLTKRPERMREYVTNRWERHLSWRGPETAPAAAIYPPDYVPRNIWLGTSVENDVWAWRRIPDLLATPAAIHFLSCEPLLGPVNLRPFLWRTKRLQWVIAGGESGRQRREMDIAWARNLRDQCADAGVAFFFKQASAFRSEQRPYLDGYKWEQYPDAPLKDQPPQLYGTCEGEGGPEAARVEGVPAYV